MKRIFYHILFFVLLGQWSFGQTTFVPDTNLRKILKTYYFQYLDINGNIVDSKAAGYTGFINCSFANVKDLTGVWKFTGIVSLVCQSNTISNVDSLGKLRELNTIYCFQNKISRIPDLSALSKLNYLSCGINQITSMPDLSANTALNYLDCGDNMVPNLKGLDKLINLQTLYVHKNKLDSLPNLSGLSKLQKIFCNDNNLSKLPGLSQLTQLNTLIAGNNRFDSLPDLSKLTKLNILMFYNCRLSTMPDVSKMPNLNQLVFSGNKITSVPNLSGNPNLSVLELNNNFISRLPDFSASKNSLNSLKLNNNQLDSLPAFSVFTTLDTVHVQNNRLTFEDIVPLTLKTGIVNVKYAPQDSVGIKQEAVITEQQSFRIVIGIDKKLSGSKYSWYRDGKPYATTSTDTLLFPHVQLGDSGIYTCQVSNTLAPLLTLNSRALKLKVKICMDISKLTYSATDFDCNSGGIVNIHESTITGGQKPFVYKLVSSELGSVHFSNGTVISNLFENTYTLEVKDNTGCKITYQNTIALKGKRGPDCKRLVILGDDNSPNNTLFLEERGMAKVYDNEGQLVQAFSTPSAWDGRNKNGEFLPGYYVIDLNGKMLNVTLIK